MDGLGKGRASYGVSVRDRDELDEDGWQSV